MFVLSVDGEMIPTECDEGSSVSLDGPTVNKCEWRCETCGELLNEDVDGYEGEDSGLACPASDQDDEADDSGETATGAQGLHSPQRLPLSWANSAEIRSDPDQDSITLSLSAFDPRGAFVFQIRRIPDDADHDLAGQLIMHVPYPGEGMLHAPLTEHHPGTYIIG